MKATKVRRKAQVNSTAARFLAFLAETSWVIATNILAGIVTLPLHAKGAPRLG